MVIVGAAAAIAFVATLVISDSIRSDERAKVAEDRLDCMDRQLNDVPTTGLDCESDVPTYAKKPFISSTLVGLGVLLIGTFTLLLSGIGRSSAVIGKAEQ